MSAGTRVRHAVGKSCEHFDPVPKAPSAQWDRSDRHQLPGNQYSTYPVSRLLHSGSSNTCTQARSQPGPLSKFENPIET
eukprot:3407745-Rhodomonas_salina.2